jgi:superfamily II DNA or RNA helicase
VCVGDKCERVTNPLEPVEANFAMIPSLHRDALAMLALAPKPAMARSPWAEFCADCGLTDVRGRRYSKTSFQEISTSLTQFGAVLEGTTGFRCVEEYVAPSVEDFARRGALRQLLLHVNSRRERSYSYSVSEGEAIQRIRCALASRDVKAMENAVTVAANSHHLGAILLSALTRHAPIVWIHELPERVRAGFFSILLDEACSVPRRPSEHVLREAVSSPVPEIASAALAFCILAGDFDMVRTRLASVPPKADRSFGAARALLEFAEGDFDKARASFAALPAATVSGKGKRTFVDGIAGVVDALLAVTDSNAPDLVAVKEILARSKRDLAPWPAVFPCLTALADFSLSGTAIAPGWYTWGESWVEAALDVLMREWLDEPSRAQLYNGSSKSKGNLLAIRDCADRTNMPWLRDRLTELLERNNKPGSLLSIIGKRDPWEAALDALDKAAGSDSQSRSAEPKALRGAVHWMIKANTEVFIAEPMLVTERSVKPLSLRTLAKRHDLPATDEDRALATIVAVAVEAYRPGLELDRLTLFMDHPKLMNDKHEAVRLRQGHAVISVEPAGEGLRLSLEPAKFSASGVALVREGCEWTLIRATAQMLKLVQIFGASGVVVPKDGSDRLHALLPRLAGTIEVRGAKSLSATVVTSQPVLCVQLFRVRGEFRARIRVRLTPDSDQTFVPGVAPAQVLMKAGASFITVARSLAGEKAAALALLDACPILSSLPTDGEDRTARDLVTCLELLLELKDVRVEWPEGEALKPPLVRSAKNINVRVTGTTNWFALEGEFKIDEARVLSMQELLAARTKSVGRFVPVGADEYLQLTEQVMQRLDALSRVQLLAGKNGISTALLPSLEEWTADTETSFSAAIEKRRVALHEASQTKTKVPRGLTATLRDYQTDGFAFLAGRASAGLGAILADDMGLGKTVQALGLLVARAKLGPQLIVSPTSVMRNWELEATRFAPALRLTRLGEGERDAVLSAAKSGDVILCPYGLLVNETEALQKVSFTTVVFDEAHALKNSATKRHLAAAALKADAVIALTGTPIENHVGELHALVSIVVPGMLGSRQAFERAFVKCAPEETARATAALRSLVRPLVLRRTKGDVLTELPPKTEMTRILQPSAEHRAFYEAVRRRALERAEKAEEKKGGGKIEMLAEIMKLRRAAIDPRLLGDARAPEGPKIEALVRLASDLREEGHRLLVFSQFLEVLDKAVEALTEAGHVTCRLDGSMSASAREAQVQKFQSGDADVFLLSLKAGGVGLNLTAADYVVHMDPWWNPAVEDQASDRAHRIGQSRPVTVIRLVTEGTIEEKVLSLHAKKRALYMDIVGEADGKGAFDTELLLSLLGEG